MSSVRTMQIFRASKKRNAAGPLDQACEWAVAHSQQGAESVCATPMLLFNEEMQNEHSDATYRQFCAFEVSTFLDAARDRTTPMYYHEIIPTNGRAKLAFDLEADFSKMPALEAAFGTRDVAAIRAGCARLCDMLVAASLDQLSALVGRPLDESAVVRLDGSRSEKWSKHIVFDGSDAATHESISFASDRDCSVFVDRVLALPEFAAHIDALKAIVDRGIYDTRHPLRIYYAAKRSNPARWFVVDGAPTAIACSATTMARALRSCFVVHDAETKFFHQSGGGVADDDVRVVTSAYLVHNPNALREPPIRLYYGPAAAVAQHTVARRSVSSISTSTAVVVGSSADALIDSIVGAPELAEYDVQSARFTDASELLVRCNTVKCEHHVNGQHSKGHLCVFLIVDVLRGRFTQLCNSTNCQERRRSVRPVRHRLPIAVRSAASAYVRSSEWAPGQVIGSEFVRALGLV